LIPKYHKFAKVLCGNSSSLWCVSVADFHANQQARAKGAFPRQGEKEKVVVSEEKGEKGKKGKAATKVKVKSRTSSASKAEKLLPVTHFSLRITDRQGHGPTTTK